MSTIVASLALLGLAGCMELGEPSEAVSADDSAITVTSAPPVVVATTTPSVSVLPAARAYDALPAGFDYVPSGCHFLAFITYSAGPGRYLTTGVCTRPRFVAWRVYGSTRGDYAAMSAAIQAQVTSTSDAYAHQAATTGVVFDFGTGGGGDFGKIGPKGGGPVGPGPGGPGGTDPDELAGVLGYLYDAAAQVEASAIVLAPSPIGHVPGGAVLTP